MFTALAVVLCALVVLTFFWSTKRWGLLGVVGIVSAGMNGGACSRPSKPVAASVAPVVASGGAPVGASGGAPGTSAKAVAAGEGLLILPAGIRRRGLSSNDLDMFPAIEIVHWPSGRSEKITIGDEPGGNMITARLSPNGARFAMIYGRPWRPGLADSDRLGDGDRRELWTANRDGLNPLRLLDVREMRQIAWSPDSALVLLVREEGPLIVDPEGEQSWSWNTCRIGHLDSMVGWDGADSVLFLDFAYYGRPRELYRCTLAGQRTLVTRLTTDDQMAFSADHSKVAVASSDHRISVTALSKWSPKPITQLDHAIFRVAMEWSPDGDWLGIVTMAHGDMFYRLQARNVDAALERRIGKTDGDDLQWWAKRPTPALGSREAVQNALGPGQRLAIELGSAPRKPAP